jgi:hypothetical protein
VIGTRLQPDREERDACDGVWPCKEELLLAMMAVLLDLLEELAVIKDMQMYRQRTASDGVGGRVVSQP